MWAAASTTALWATVASSVGSMLYIVVSAILVVVVGLMMLGFGLRKTKKHVTGKKF